MVTRQTIAVKDLDLEAVAVVVAVGLVMVATVWSVMIGVAGQTHARDAVIINCSKIHPLGGRARICMLMKEIDSCNWCIASVPCSRLFAFTLCSCFSEAAFPLEFQLLGSRVILYVCYYC